MRTISLKVLFLHLVNHLQASKEGFMSAAAFNFQSTVTLMAQVALARFQDLQAACSGHDCRMEHSRLQE